MNGQPSGYNSQPSGHSPQPTQPTLSIRTATPSGPPRGVPNSAPAQTNPTYPILIPDTKLEKAIRLYTKYWLEEGLSQRVQPPRPTHADPLLSPATAHSVPSRSYAPSVSTSAYEGLTDISSLVSFNEEENPPGTTDLIAFDGTRVRRRVRKPLSPTAKAKAALIRYLGSCSNCRTRRVPCPFEHHDIAALERGRQARSQRTRHQTPQLPSQSSLSTYSLHAPDSSHAIAVTTSGGTLGQSNTLLGLGQNEQLLLTVPTSTADPLSLGDPLAGIQARGTAPLSPGMGDSDDISPFINFDQDESYQNGQLIALGVLRGHFVCQHLDGLCGQRFKRPEELELHFETDHFAFTRIRPPYRYTCSNCGYMQSSLPSQCQNCPGNGVIEMWIYGNVIRSSLYQPRYAPDGQDPFRMQVSPFPQTMSMYDFTGTDPQFGGPGGAAGFNGDMNAGGYNYQGHSTYQSPTTPGYDFDSYGSPQSGAYQNHDSGFIELQSEPRSSPFSVSYWHAKAPHNYRRYSHILIMIFLLVLVFLVSMAAIAKAPQWLMVKAQGFQSRPSLPVIGFVSVLASFLLGCAFWSSKNLGLRRSTHSTQCRPRRCPLHGIPILLDNGPAGRPLHVSIK